MKVFIFIKCINFSEGEKLCFRYYSGLKSACLAASDPLTVLSREAGVSLAADHQFLTSESSDEEGALLHDQGLLIASEPVCSDIIDPAHTQVHFRVSCKLPISHFSLFYLVTIN